MKSPITITAAAHAQIVKILQDRPGHLLVLGMNNKGCSGHSYTFDLQPMHEINPLDELIDLDGYQVLIPAVHVFRLIGSTLDHVQDQFGQKFVWHNPAVNHVCGCGASVGF